MNRSRTRRALAFLALLAVLVVLANRLVRKTSTPPSEPEPEPAPVAPSSATPGPASAPAVTRLPVAAEAARLNAPEGNAGDDLMLLDLLISDFRKHQGGNPVGENEEIAAALLGKNPKGLVYLPEAGAFLDARGRLIDRWGTPYFFHALAGNRMDIRSAGPDKLFWTDDDIFSGS